MVRTLGPIFALAPFVGSLPHAAVISVSDPKRENGRSCTTSGRSLWALRPRLIAALCVLNAVPSLAAPIYSATVLNFTSPGLPSSGVSDGGGSQQVGHSYRPSGEFHATLWNGTAASAVDLNPVGFRSSTAEAISGGQQVGYGYHASGDVHTPRALLWSGSAASVVDLSPSGFLSSTARGVGGGQQVGYAHGPSSERAILWSGTAASAVNLHPSGFYESAATAVDRGKQVGVGYLLNGPGHALLWNGTAASALDLNPSGFTSSYASSISGGQQVGSGWAPSFGTHLHAGLPMANSHALLWSGTAASARDLNPSGFTVSFAADTNGSKQVGAGWNASLGISTNTHALVWSGTAASAVDLHQFLPSGFISSSAVSIDNLGNVLGSALDSSFKSHTILWKPGSASVPPTSFPNTRQKLNGTDRVKFFPSLNAIGYGLSFDGTSFTAAIKIGLTGDSASSAVINDWEEGILGKV
jgi:hypothetical protein